MVFGMMFAIVLLMMGGYFGLINAIIPVLDVHYPKLSTFCFVLISWAYVVSAMRIQTRVERFYNSRHVRKNPHSLWRHAATRMR